MPDIMLLAGVAIAFCVIAQIIANAFIDMGNVL